MKIKISVSNTSSLVVGFRNKIQCKLYEDELQGQMSDGYWENSTPHDHWELPCRAKAVVATSPSALGPNFIPIRSYNFAAAQLVDAVGDRMVKIAQKIDKSYTMQHLVKDLKDMSAIFNHKRTGKDAPAAPSAPGVRASPIKGSDRYQWFTFTGSKPVVITRRGQQEQIHKGCVYGIRKSGNGKEVRLIFKDAETLVYTLTPQQIADLSRGSVSS